MRISELKGPLAVALIYYLGGILALTVPWSRVDITLVWPCTGFIIGAALPARAERRWRYMLVGAAMSFLVNLQTGSSLYQSAAYAVANSAELWLALALCDRMCRPRMDFTILDHLTRFCMIAVIVSAAGATIALPASGASHDFWISWFLTHVLGILLVTPLTQFVIRLGCGDEKVMGERGLIEAGAILLLLAGVTVVTFHQSSYPLLFVPMAALYFATYRLGVIGSVAGIVVVATVVAASTAMGGGPHLPAGSGRFAIGAFNQFYLAICFIATVPMATHIRAERRHADRLTISERYHRNMVDRSSGILFEADANGCWTFLNPAWSGITGRSIAETIGTSALDAVDPADRPRTMVKLHMLCDRRCEEVRFEVRVAGQPAEAPRWVGVTARLGPAADGEAEGFYGLIRDVTDRVRAERALAESERRYRLLAKDATRAAQEARLQADTDELTGLANRRLFLRRLEREVAHTEESGRALSIAIFDVDHFKRINDMFGHAAGDEMLRHVAQAASGAVRMGDLVGRVGGEEFAVLMPGAEASHALAVAERIRAAVAAHTTGLTHLPMVTVSVGVARHGGATSALALLAQADSALYQAKETGRDRLCLAA